MRQAAALLLVALWAVLGTAWAAPPPQAKPFAEHFLVLQLSDAEPAKQSQVLSVAANLLEHYGPDRIDIEVVAFGPGIRLLYRDNPHRERVDSLAAQGVRFIGCLNTIETIERQTGTRPALVEHMIPAQAGVAHILERVGQGYTLVRP